MSARREVGLEVAAATNLALPSTRDLNDAEHGDHRTHADEVQRLRREGENELLAEAEPDPEQAKEEVPNASLHGLVLP